MRKTAKLEYLKTIPGRNFWFVDTVIFIIVATKNEAKAKLIEIFTNRLS